MNAAYPFRLDLRLGIRQASQILLFFGSLQPLALLMGRRFKQESGFWPTWWIECPGCGSPDLSIPYDWPLFGGFTLAGILAVVIAGVLLATASRLGELVLRRVAIVATGLCFLHIIASVPVRYPGPLPTLLIGTLTPGLAGLGFLRASVTNQRSTPITDPRGRLGSLLTLATGYLSMLALGGYATPLIALGVAAYQWPRTAPAYRGFIVMASVLAWVAFVGRLTLAASAQLYFWWL